jgi:hypothetical protein
LLIGGEFRESADWMWSAIRLNPFPPPWYGSSLMNAYLADDHPARAIQVGEEYLGRVPDGDTFFQARYRMILIASHAKLGQFGESARIATELRTILPNVKIDAMTAYDTAVWRDRRAVIELQRLLRQAGLP